MISGSSKFIELKTIYDANIKNITFNEPVTLSNGARIIDASAVKHKIEINYFHSYKPIIMDTSSKIMLVTFSDPSTTNLVGSKSLA